jgi:CheY-like chemotaxis protein
LFASALRRDSTDGQNAILQRLDRSIESAEALLRALLDISKLDAGGITPHIEPVQLRPLITELVETMGPLAREKGIHVRIGPGDAMVESDQGLLRSIVQNFLSNAIRYTGKGGILVGIRRRGVHARIDVIDTGPGIPDDKQTAIFREFERLPGAGDGGIGLGLAIVERTARLIDARISLRSRVGHGSRFSVTLARAQEQAPMPPPVAEAIALHGRSLSILVVDDNANNADALTSYLRSKGHQVVQALTADDAFASAGRFDVLLADFNLGDGDDGLDLAAQMLSADRVRRAALVTAARPADYEARASAKNVSVFRKPLSTDALDRWLADERGYLAAE